MTILPKPVSRGNKITRKKYYWKNCQVSENSKNDIRTTPNNFKVTLSYTYFS
jgi:hypothetical protein